MWLNVVQLKRQSPLPRVHPGAHRHALAKLSASVRCKVMVRVNLQRGPQNTEQCVELRSLRAGGAIEERISIAGMGARSDDTLCAHDVLPHDRLHPAAEDMANLCPSSGSYLSMVSINPRLPHQSNSGQSAPRDQPQRLAGRATRGCVSRGCFAADFDRCHADWSCARGAGHGGGCPRGRPRPVLGRDRTGVARRCVYVT